MMTFKQFQQSGRDVPDLNQADVGIEINEGEPSPGRVYDSNLYIEKSLGGQPMWTLTIYNCQWGDDELKHLEMLLYDHAIAEQSFGDVKWHDAREDLYLRATRMAMVHKIESESAYRQVGHEVADIRWGEDMNVFVSWCECRAFIDQYEG